MPWNSLVLSCSKLIFQQVQVTLLLHIFPRKKERELESYIFTMM